MHWNRISRTYSFQLARPAESGDKSYVLQVWFDQSGRRLTRQVVLEAQEAKIVTPNHHPRHPTRHPTRRRRLRSRRSRSLEPVPTLLRRDQDELPTFGERCNEIGVPRTPAGRTPVASTSWAGSPITPVVGLRRDARPRRALRWRARRSRPPGVLVQPVRRACAVHDPHAAGRRWRAGGR